MNYVESLSSYLQLLKYCHTHYAQEPAMTDASGTLTYAGFIDIVRQYAALVLQTPQRYIIPSSASQIRYAAAYFAIVLTGHIAVLLPNGHVLPASLQGALHLTDELFEKNSDRVSVPTLDELQPSAPEECCTIAFSSGTASAAKGIMLSQRNLLEDAQHGMRLHRYWQGERLVHILPYWHLFGIVADLLGPLQAGCHLYMAESPLHFFPALRSFRPHSINLPPALADTLCQAIAAAGEPAQVTGGCLEKLMCAGAPLKQNTLEKLLELGIKPCLAYGLTECSPCVSLTSEDDIIPGSSGKPLGCVTVCIAADGEILVRGSTVMLGYYQDPVTTASRLVNGWLHTGDLGYLSEEGHLFVTGRKSSMLVFSSGIKCMPEPIEERIAQLDCVQECLLGCSDDEQHAVITIVTQEKTFTRCEELDKIMQQAGLIPYVLRIQHKSLQRNAMGKLVR